MKLNLKPYMNKRNGQIILIPKKTKLPKKFFKDKRPPKKIIVEKWRWEF